MVHRAPDSPALRRRNAIRIVVATLCIGAVAAITIGIVYVYRPHPTGTPVSEAVYDRATDRAARGDARLEPGTPAPSPSLAAAPSTPAAPAAKPSPRATKTTTAPGCGSYSGNRRTACNLLGSFGFSTGQMSALDQLWDHESGWNHRAENPSSGAYGIPQALPGSKMGSVAADWRTNPVTQITWGLGYIKDRYGTPAAAWSFWQANNWY